MGLYRKESSTEVSQVAGNVDYSEIQSVKDSLNKITNYTTEEKIVGTFNNKPIYERTIYLTNVSRGATLATIPNLKFLIDVSGCVVSDQFGQTIPISFAHQDTISYNIGVVYFPSNSSLVLSAGTGFNGFTEAFVIIRYNKSTD